MIEEVLPSGVLAAECFGDLNESLHREERRCIDGSVDARRREFVTVRACARSALARAGLSRPPLVPGHGGAPTWPPAVVGSMTHCTGYRAAAIASAGDFEAIGIDAEPHAALPHEVLDDILVGDELTQLVQLRRRWPEVHGDRVIFSAKESVFKAWYPLTERWLDFKDVTIRLHASQRTFSAVLGSSGRRERDENGVRSGRWCVGNGFVLTCFSFPVSSDGQPSCRRDGTPGRVRAQTAAKRL